ncbi:response regulator receiver protein [Arthrobacter sp. SPG23]|uniref:PAS and ANTAR domain-containing protein n=1 Tax=Arthrobacter sp. SPG23 TaxID=1610703 RepID=UPI0005B8A3B7|nr:PAS and ANTAR domain-containing protein [Arthrobacter sp. SPG23]KIS26231.1 response regulator receiver protein [Arthrobacter sp. SPG23]
MNGIFGRAETYSSALGPSALLAGTFVLDAKTRAMDWSDEVYAIHGYSRGDVVPTLELTMAHKHPDDLARIQEITRGVYAHGGHVAIYHRLVDARRRERKVLTAGEAVLDEAGNLVTVSGIMLDLTSTIQRETELAAREAVRGAVGTRSTIAKAEGILIGRLGIGSDDAFKLLINYSNNRNIKLASVACGLVALADNPADAGALGCVIQELVHARHRRPARQRTRQDEASA